MAEIQSQSTPDLPWTVRLFVSAASFAVDASRRSNFTVNRCLFNLVDYKPSPLTKPHKNLKSSDVVVAADPSRNLWFRLYTPTAAPTTKLPIIVFFHGGGFVFMSAASKPYDDFCQRLARELPAVVVSVNYRLAPEHRYPCQYDDGFDVLKFIDDSQSSLFEGANLGQCFLAGDSAGGNIAHHVVIGASGHKFRELQVVGMLAIQPFFGGEERTESETRLKSVPLVNIERTDWMWKAFLPEGSDRDHRVVNVFGPNAVDISGVDFPATIVFVGGFDPLQDWQKRYYEGLKKRGKQAELVVFPNAIHTFYSYPELDDSSLLINKVRDFVQLQSVNVAETRQ